MKKLFALMLAPVILLLILVTAGSDHATSPSKDAATVHFTSLQTGTPTQQTAAEAPATRKPASVKAHAAAIPAPESDPLIAYAMSLMGSPYVFGGTDSDGFDCSGFTSHVFQEFGIPVTRSSTTQSEDGIPVSRAEAQPGDLVIFTGTNPQVRKPGHVGIVISAPGDTISFVHASSNGGVKISQVEGTGYEKRFLDIRRVL